MHLVYNTKKIYGSTSMLFFILFLLISTVISYGIVSLFALAKRLWVLLIPLFSSLLLGGYLFFLERVQEAEERKLPLNYYSHPFSEPSTGTSFILLLVVPLIFCTFIWTVYFLVKVDYKDKKENVEE